MRRVHAKSAVVSVRTPGVLAAGMPRLVASATSMLLKPTAMFAITLRSGSSVQHVRINAIGEEAVEGVIAATLETFDQFLFCPDAVRVRIYVEDAVRLNGFAQAFYRNIGHMLRHQHAHGF